MLKSAASSGGYTPPVKPPAGPSNNVAPLSTPPNRAYAPSRAPISPSSTQGGGHLAPSSITTPVK